MLIPSNKQESKRYNEILLLQYEFIQLITKFNPAVSYLSKDSIIFFIEYCVANYDDKTNSNYNFINEEMKIISNKINNDDHYKNDELIKQFKSFEKRLNDYPPHFLSKTLSKNDKKWLSIPINSIQLGKKYNMNNKEVCRIKFPDNSKYSGYYITVPTTLIHKKDNKLYFNASISYINQISRWNKNTKSWEKAEISSEELKLEFENNILNESIEIDNENEIEM